MIKNYILNLKFAILFLIALCILVLFKISDSTFKLSEILLSKEFTNSSKFELNRKKMILELKKVKQILSSKNKNKIADIFEFPLSKEIFEIYSDDTTFNEQLKANNNKISREIFLQYFKVFSTSFNFKEINKLFELINLEKLLNCDKLEYEAYKKFKPCYNSYLIELTNDTITLSVNSNSNRNFYYKKINEDEVPLNSSEYCEHNLFWIITFDGNKLHLKSISGAD